MSVPSLNPRFKCRATFPQRIPTVLASHGLKVTDAPWLSSNPAPTGEFGYLISEGACQVVVTGGIFRDGIAGYLVALWPVSDIRFWLRSKKRSLRERVQSVLVDVDGTLWGDYSRRFEFKKR